MNIRNATLIALLLLLVIAIAPVTAQEGSLTWTLPDYSGGAIEASVLDENLITVEVTGLGDVAPMVNVTCRNAETGEESSVLLNPIVSQATANGRTMQFDVASQWLGLPYPVDPWALESKPMAIISERVRLAPFHMTPAAIREEFSWVSAYMLETARHSYALPLGDGLLDCRFQSGDVTSEPLEVVFGRGLPEVAFERDLSSPDMSDWATWVVDETLTPPTTQTADWAVPLYEGTLEQNALIRHWDNGAAVSPWIEITMSRIIESHTNPPRASRIYGLVSVAMYDALVAGNGQYSEHALVAGAASTVLTYLFPEQAEEWLALAEEAMQSRVWADSMTPDDLQTAFVFGQQVGNLVVERGKGDRSGAAFEGTRPEGDAYWVPDLPAFAGPQEPMTGTWKPWNLSSGDQFRPAPPPQFGTPEYEEEAHEVYEAGINLTLEQQMTASFWEDKIGTTTPPGHWNIIALHLVREAGLSSADAARVFATMNTAQADAFIAAWDAKYTYWSVRPITGIRRLFDETWKPYIYTPGFPSYISGHSTTSGAASTVLVALFPEDAEQITAWATEAMESRLLGGIHYRSDNEVGLAVGQQVGGEALAHIGLR